MQQAEPNPEDLQLVPSAEFVRNINGLRTTSPVTYALVVAAQSALTASLKFYLDQACVLESHSDQYQSLVTVKGVRLLFRQSNGRHVLDHFVVRNQLT